MVVELMLISKQSNLIKIIKKINDNLQLVIQNQNKELIANKTE